MYILYKQQPYINIISVLVRIASVGPKAIGIVGCKLKGIQFYGG